MADEFNPNLLMVHLDHPCYELDSFYAGSQADADAVRGQGYVSIAELCKMNRDLATRNELIGNLQHELGIARAQIAELTDYKAVTEPMVAELQAQLQALGVVVDAQNRQLKAVYLTRMVQAQDEDVQP